MSVCHGAQVSSEANKGDWKPWNMSSGWRVPPDMAVGNRTQILWRGSQYS